MPISKIPVGAIQSGTIATTQIADNAVTTAKILDDNVTSAKIPNDAVGSTEISANAVTRDELQSAAVNNISSDSIILNSTNGTADAGDFLVLDGTDGSSSNANHRILFDETFNPSTFNVSGTATAGNAIKVKTGGGFEFGDAATHQLLVTSTASNDASITFDSMDSRGFKVYVFDIINMQPATNDQRPTLQVAGADGTIDTGAIYKFASKGHSSTGSDLDTADNSANQYRILGDSTSVGNEADEGCNFKMYMYNADSSTVFTQFFTQGASMGSDYITTMITSCAIFEANTTTKVQFTFASGNIASGTFKLYGVN